MCRRELDSAGTAVGEPDMIFGNVKEAADGLCRFVAECDAQVDANNEIVN